MTYVIDKNGRDIEVGDVLKVYHFTGRNRRRHYMYKQVVERVNRSDSTLEHFVISHLTEKRQVYILLIEDQYEPNYEIVQSWDANFELREKRIRIGHD